MGIGHHHLSAAAASEDPVTAQESLQCQCGHCGTDEFLVPESVKGHQAPDRSERRGWDVSYWCSKCDRYYGHFTLQLPAAWTSDRE
ncbi:hypothetical protein [Arthrobacter sp.]|uniref:hypothetical protein n=1 Tax=Arthrobacter sp. TaxID=1667 RepID=UPI003A8EAD82